MPLDRENGEKLEAIPGAHVVIPTEILAGLSNVMADYEVWDGIRKVKGRRTLFADAVVHAFESFAKAGSLSRSPFDDEDMLVQVYPDLGKVAVLFQRRIRGEDHYAWRAYELPQPLIGALLERAGKPRSIH